MFQKIKAEPTERQPMYILVIIRTSTYFASAILFLKYPKYMHELCV